MIKGRNGFTLIELIVVIIIIGILATISAPLAQTMKARAICTEAVTVMGTIRTAVMTYRAGHDKYPKIYGFVDDYDVDSSYNPDKMAEMGINVNDLTGYYFSKNCYYINTDVFFSVYAEPNPEKQPAGQPNNAPGKLDTDKTLDNPADAGMLKMDIRTGRVIQINMSKSGYPSS